jgi:hypothetical protein
MAERQRMTGREILIGIAVLIPVFVIAYLGAGALAPQLPQWVVSAVAAVVGILIWFALIGRLGGKKN